MVGWRMKELEEKHIKERKDLHKEGEIDNTMPTGGAEWKKETRVGYLTCCMSYLHLVV